MNNKCINLVLPILASLVVGGCSNNQPNPTTYKISFSSNEHVTICDLPEVAAEGTNVKFRLFADEGYKLTEVKVQTNEYTVDLTGDAKTGLSFVMPAADITIDAKTLGLYFSVTADETEEVFRTEIEEKKYTISDFVAGYRVNNENIASFSTNVRAGEDVYVLVNKFGISKNVKLFANEVEAVNTELEIKDDSGEVIDIYNTYKFVMPADDVKITMTAEEDVFTVDVALSVENIASVVVRNKQDEVTNTFKSGKRIYISVDINDAYKDKYTINEVDITYQQYNGYSLKDIHQKDPCSIGAPVDGTYRHLIETTTLYGENKIHFRVEFSEYKYAGKEFLGNYRAFKISNTSINPVSYEDAYKINITSDGTFKENYTSIQISDLDETNKTFKLNSMPMSKVAHYDTDMIWYPNFSNDAIVGWKNWNENNSFIVSGTYEKVALIELLDADELTSLNNFLRLNGNNYMNVEIDYEYKDSEDITKSKFYVKKNGVVVDQYGIE